MSGIQRKHLYVFLLAIATPLIAICGVSFWVPRDISADRFFEDASSTLQSGGAELAETAQAPSTEGVGRMSVDPPVFADLVKKVSGAVVNIASEADDEDTEGEEKLLPFPFFRRGPGQPFRSLGSGFIINKEGFIVTNNHVIKGADKIIVRLLDDKNDYEADLIGSDEKTDLALIKIKANKNLTTIALGDSDTLQVGEWVVAIGNQFQLGQTVTAGIVSAKSRRVPTRGGGPYDQFIQTDASINPGSSGGPLVNIRGDVIGINTAIFSPGRQQSGGQGFNIGIGFAIPINMARDIISQLRAQGRVTRGLLGVVIQTVTTDIAKILNLKEPHGALVSDVIDSSPASRAGFKRKDVIVSYNGQKVSEHSELPLMVANTPIGTKVSVGVIRNNKEIKLSPRIEELTDARFMVEREEPKSDVLGLMTRKVDAEIAEILNQKTPVGVFVKKVQPGSAASEAGIVRGDVIIELADKRVLGLSEYRKALEGLVDGEPVLVLVRRKEGTRFLTLIKK